MSSSISCTQLTILAILLSILWTSDTRLKSPKRLKRLKHLIVSPCCIVEQALAQVSSSRDLVDIGATCPRFPASCVNKTWTYEKCEKAERPKFAKTPGMASSPLRPGQPMEQIAPLVACAACHNGFLRPSAFWDHEMPRDT